MRRYDFADVPEINGWFKARGLPELPADAFPRIGFIYPGVAAGFLYQTDSCVAFIENYITNPRAARDLRDTALDHITRAIIFQSQQLGVVSLIALTQTDAIVERAKRHGFGTIGQYVMMRREI